MEIFSEFKKNSQNRLRELLYLNFLKIIKILLIIIIIKFLTKPIIVKNYQILQKQILIQSLDISIFGTRLKIFQIKIIKSKF